MRKMPIFSMTGFGRSAVASLVVEIQSVNRKQLEIQCSLPRQFLSFEPELRKLVSQHVSRGSVSVRVTVQGGKQAVAACVSDLKALKKRWETVAVELGFSKQDISLPFLLEQIALEGPAPVQNTKELTKALSLALSGLRTMQEKEGTALFRDITSRLKLIEKHLSHIETTFPTTIATLRQTLTQRLTELAQIADERLIREIPAYAEKLDITEELTRLRSHMSQFLTTTSGRKMEFLLQEMGREVNTIGSKAQSFSSLIVDIKTELEKIREQVQNIE